MRLLVLGGTRFLSSEVAAEAVRRGHEVVCACRGASGSVPPGARLVGYDRSGPMPASLAAESFDAVVDVGRLPSWSRSAVAAFPDAHHVFVSTVNVYADDATPGQSAASARLRDPQPLDVDLAVDPEAYGPMKVACEQIVLARAASATIVRPGLIVGPGDPTGRFTYWAVRLGDLAEHPEVLGPGAPSDAVQVIDVRDLAAWIVACAADRRTGVFDGVGPVTTIRELLGEIGFATPTWVGQELLLERGVVPWAGPGSIPLWLPRPEYDGMLAHDAGPSLAAGLTVRPVGDSARDTLAWVRATPGAEVGGLTRAEERALLAACSTV